MSYATANEKCAVEKENIANALDGDGATAMHTFNLRVKNERARNKQKIKKKRSRERTKKSAAEKPQKCLLRRRNNEGELFCQSEHTPVHCCDFFSLL